MLLEIATITCVKVCTIGLSDGSRLSAKSAGTFQVGDKVELVGNQLCRPICLEEDKEDYVPGLFPENPNNTQIEVPIPRENPFNNQPVRGLW
jgi:hypothetical protein